MLPLTTALLFRYPSSSLHSRFGGLVVYARRQQKIKRWGDGGGGGFAANNRKQNSGEDNELKSSTTSSSPPISKPIITAAEYARMNTLAAKHRHAVDESKRHVTEYLEQQLPAKSRQLLQISESPLIFVIDDFIDPKLCRKVDNQANGCFHLLFPEAVADQLFQGQASELDGLLFNTASSDDHGASGSDHPNYPDGLHMDTNNQCLFRHVTCLLYLNDVPENCGGGTVFPVARALSSDPVMAAAQRLLDCSMSHTRSREIRALGLEEDARLLESRIHTNCMVHPDTDTAIKVQPKAGRLLVFFSRDEYGREDPRTWHAGERILPGSDGSVTEKRILTLFKEVDYEGRLPREDASTFEAFLEPQIASQRQWLQAKAQLQKALLSRIKGDLEV